MTAPDIPKFRKPRLRCRHCKLDYGYPGETEYPKDCSHCGTPHDPAHDLFPNPNEAHS